MKPITRRGFVAASAGFAIASRARGADSPASKVVLGLIGAGGRGHALATGLALVPGVDVKYVCDIDSTRGVNTMRELEKVQGKAPQRVNDMRRLLDDKDLHAVIIATPDHWHALATIWACQAAKDVYVEKNLSYSIWEGRKMVEAARKYKRIVQCGTQMRSSPYANSARDYIASGKLGKVAHVKIYNMLSGGPFKEQPQAQPPATLDWDQWLGHRPLAPYSVTRHRGWYSWYDYCGGDLGNDGSHQLDLFRHVMGDPPTPRFVHSSAGNFAYNSKRPVPEFQEVTFEFPQFVATMTSCSFPPYLRKSNNEERNGDKFPLWPMNNERIEIYGTKQMMYLGRHGVGWQVLEAEGKIVAQEKGVHPDKFHQPNFIECIRSRKLPNADVEIAHQGATLAHLGNIAHRTGNLRLEFDGATEHFVGHDPANTFLKPVMREKYQVPDEV